MSLCLSCNDKPVETIFRLCRHIVFCEECSQQYLNSNRTTTHTIPCPVCRKSHLADIPLDRIYLSGFEKNSTSTSNCNILDSFSEELLDIQNKVEKLVHELTISREQEKYYRDKTIELRTKLRRSRRQIKTKIVNMIMRDFD